MKRTPLLLLLLAVNLTPGQESSSFKLIEHTFNAGGHPEAGVVATSSSFRVTLDAIDEGLAGTALTSASFLMDSGFTASFPPPGEVENLRFISEITMIWDADSSMGDYALYRGTVPGITPGYGACLLPTPASETATDLTLPTAGQALAYIITSRNRLLEEGTKGFTSAGLPRSNSAPCP